MHIAKYIVSFILRGFIEGIYGEPVAASSGHGGPRGRGRKGGCGRGGGGVVGSTEMGGL